MNNSQEEAMESVHKTLVNLLSQWFTIHDDMVKENGLDAAEDADSRAVALKGVVKMFAEWMMQKPHDDSCSQKN